MDFEKIDRVLGEGTYAKVYETTNEKGNKVAVKKIIYDNKSLCERDFGDIINEVFILLSITGHPNIVQFLEFHNINSIGYLIFEVYPQTLQDIIEEEDLCLVTINKMIKQLLQGLSFIHEKMIIHRDLKPANILIDYDMNLKICDFGLSVSKFNRYYDFYDKNGNNTHQIQTLWYRAPEILLGADKYDSSIDIWSVGCIITEFFTGEPLFEGDCEIGQLFKIFEIKGTPTNKEWTNVEFLPEYNFLFPKYNKKKIVDCIEDLDMLDLLEKLLDYNPINRIKASDAIKHKFFLS